MKREDIGPLTVDGVLAFLCAAALTVLVGGHPAFVSVGEGTLLFVIAACGTACFARLMGRAPGIRMPQLALLAAVAGATLSIHASLSADTGRDPSLQSIDYLPPAWRPAPPVCDGTVCLAHGGLTVSNAATL